MLVRHGIMLVGPTGGGKTVARNILQKALQILPSFVQKKESIKESEEEAGLDKQKSLGNVNTLKNIFYLTMNLHFFDLQRVLQEYMA